MYGIKDYTGLSPAAFFTVLALMAVACKTVYGLFVGPEELEKKAAATVPSGPPPPAEPVQLGDVTELRAYDPSKPLIEGQNYNESGCIEALFYSDDYVWPERDNNMIYGSSCREVRYNSDDYLWPERDNNMIYGSSCREARYNSDDYLWPERDNNMVDDRPVGEVLISSTRKLEEKKSVFLVEQRKSLVDKLASIDHEIEHHTRRLEEIQSQLSTQQPHPPSRVRLSGCREARYYSDDDLSPESNNNMVDNHPAGEVLMSNVRKLEEKKTVFLVEQRKSLLNQLEIIDQEIENRTRRLEDVESQLSAKQPHPSSRRATRPPPPPPVLASSNRRGCHSLHSSGTPLHTSWLLDRE